MFLSFQKEPSQQNLQSRATRNFGFQKTEGSRNTHAIRATSSREKVSGVKETEFSSKKGINLSRRDLKELIFVDKKVFAANVGMKISNLNSPKDSRPNGIAGKREN